MCRLPCYSKKNMCDRHNKFAIDHLKLYSAQSVTYSSSVIGNISVDSRYVNTARSDLNFGSNLYAALPYLYNYALYVSHIFTYCY